MVMATPAIGVFVRSSTLPRRTATRTGSIVPAATPVCRGFVPVYKNATDDARLVGTPGSIPDTQLVQPPPQSMPVSAPFWTPSLHDDATHVPATHAVLAQ